LNDTTASRLGFQLELRDWSEFVRPSMGRPQKVVFDQIPVETWDIFIGLLWMRFGTPTGAIDPATGLPFAAGTQEEFRLAYESWQNAGKPNIMFYRCLRPAVPVHDEDEIVHLTRVNEFFKQFEHDKANPGLYRKFIHGEEFVEYIQKDLTNVLFDTWQKRKRDGEEEGGLVPDQAYDAVAVGRHRGQHDDGAAAPPGGVGGLRVVRELRLAHLRRAKLDVKEAGSDLRSSQKTKL
jgi:hypothetical protein